MGVGPSLHEACTEGEEKNIVKDPLLGGNETHGGGGNKDNSSRSRVNKTPTPLLIILIIVVICLLGGGITAAVILSINVTKEVTLSPIDSNILRIGRWDTRNEKKPAFSWSGSGFRLALNGTVKASIKLSHNYTKPIPFDCWVDGNVSEFFVDNNGTINLTFTNRSKPHVIELARRIETRYGPVYFEGVVVEHNQ